MSEARVETGSPPQPRIKHEPSNVDAGTIVSVMVGLTLVGFLIYVVVAWLAGHFEAEGRAAAVNANPLEARRNREPLNQRLEEVRQPRLEGLQQLQGEPPWMRSSLPTVEGNFPAFHADNLRPEAQPRLQSYGWVDKDKGIAHIPIGQAMSAALKMNLLPAQPGSKELNTMRSGPDRAKESNSGQGAGGGPK